MLRKIKIMTKFRYIFPRKKKDIYIFAMIHIFVKNLSFIQLRKFWIFPDYF